MAMAMVMVMVMVMVVAVMVMVVAVIGLSRRCFTTTRDLLLSATPPPGPRLYLKLTHGFMTAVI